MRGSKGSQTLSGSQLSLTPTRKTAARGTRYVARPRSIISLLGHDGFYGEVTARTHNADMVTETIIQKAEEQPVVAMKEGIV